MNVSGICFATILLTLSDAVRSSLFPKQACWKMYLMAVFQGDNAKTQQAQNVKELLRKHEESISPQNPELNPTKSL